MQASWILAAASAALLVSLQVALVAQWPSSGTAPTKASREECLRGIASHLARTPISDGVRELVSSTRNFFDGPEDIVEENGPIESYVQEPWAIGQQDGCKLVSQHLEAYEEYERCPRDKVHLEKSDTLARVAKIEPKAQDALEAFFACRVVLLKPKANEAAAEELEDEF